MASVFGPIIKPSVNISFSCRYCTLLENLITQVVYCNSRRSRLYFQLIYPTVLRPLDCPGTMCALVHNSRRDGGGES